MTIRLRPLCWIFGHYAVREEMNTCTVRWDSRKGFSGYRETGYVVCARRGGPLMKIRVERLS